MSAPERRRRRDLPDVNAARELGDAYQDAGRLADAVAAYRHALRCDPESTRAWYALGCAELARGEFVRSARSFGEALARRPGWIQAEHNLACALFHLGRTDEAFAHFRRCAGSGDAGAAALARAMVALIAPQAPSADNRTILACRRAWVARDLRPWTPARRPRRRGATSERPLRIGYLSSFFHGHNWMKPVWALVNAHDRSRFEVHLLSAAPASRIRWGYHADPRDRFHHVGRMSNEELSDFIRTLQLDVLVDLNGYSDMRRLPLVASRPAPVVVAWFNSYATSGMEAVDYLIGDHQVAPVAEESLYTERIRRVSGSYLTFVVDYPVPDVAPPPCLARRAIRFGSFASQHKITAGVIAAWSRILERSAGSSLLVKNRALRSVANREFVYGQFARRGIPRGRVRLEGPAEHYAFLKAYQDVDIALDTFPYNGGTTTTEALWQGVPVVTFWGDRWLSRTSASILRSGALDRFVRRDLDDYVSFAAELANDRRTPAYLAALRRGMRSSLRSSDVCDARSLARQVEAIYREATAVRSARRGPSSGAEERRPLLEDDLHRGRGQQR